MEADSGVIDEDVDRSVLLCDRLEHRGDTRSVRDIRRDCAHAKLARHPIRPGNVARRDHDPRARLGQGAREGHTETAVPPGYDRNLAVEAEAVEDAHRFRPPR